MLRPKRQHNPSIDETIGGHTVNQTDKTISNEYDGRVPVLVP